MSGPLGPVPGLVNAMSYLFNLMLGFVHPMQGFWAVMQGRFHLITVFLGKLKFYLTNLTRVVIMKFDVT